jgi:hypothetical protein
LQTLSKVPMQGINPDVFNRGGALTGIGPLSAAPLGLADPPPVGGLISGARKPIPLHKGFHQKNRMAILLLPIRA